MNRRLLHRPCLAALALVLAAGTALPQAPSPGFGRVTGGFNMPDFYPPPNQNQMKSQLSCAEAEPLAGGLIRMKQVKLESFQVSGVLEWTMQASECTYDTTTRSASSPGALRMTSGNGQLVIEGTGFRWQQTNSVFTISNQTRTTLSPPPQKIKTTNQ
jgi:hypothetical protein